MHRLLVSFLALAALGGCTDFSDSYQGMLFDSETCRSSAEDNLAAATRNDRTSQDRERRFDNTYRTCMTTKGYDLSGENPSTRL